MAELKVETDTLNPPQVALLLAPLSEKQLDYFMFSSE